MHRTERGAGEHAVTRIDEKRRRRRASIGDEEGDRDVIATQVGATTPSAAVVVA
jgi:hypothetical protein